MYVCLPVWGGAGARFFCLYELFSLPWMLLGYNLCLCCQHFSGQPKKPTTCVATLSVKSPGSSFQDPSIDKKHSSEMLIYRDHVTVKLSASSAKFEIVKKNTAQQRQRVVTSSKRGLLHFMNLVAHPWKMVVGRRCGLVLGIVLHSNTSGKQETIWFSSMWQNEQQRSNSPSKTIHCFIASILLVFSSSLSPKGKKGDVSIIPKKNTGEVCWWQGP